MIGGKHIDGVSLRSQRGIGLVEMMIAATLGLIVMASVFQIYINARQSQRMNNALFRLQENGRVAISLMKTTARMAGYVADGTASVDTVFPASGAFAKGAAVVGVEDDDDAGNGIKDHTDWFMVRYQGNAQDNLVFDCLGNPLPSGNPAYPNDVLPMTFGISNDNELFCERGGGGVVSRVTIADGVADMQLLYGVDDNADKAADYYVSADSVPDFSRVVSIRISLLLQSDDRITLGPVGYSYNGVTISDPGDRRFRFVFNTTVALRNVTGEG